MFNFDFTKDKFEKIVKTNNPDFWFKILVDNLPKYEINTKNRVAGFLAQTGHESVDYNVLEENLNYSSLGLRKTFPKYFSSVAFAKSFAKKPEKIANYVYGNRYGNGPASTGDGWKYHGRGLIMVTFKSNYERCSKFLFNDLRLVEKPNLITEEKENCVLSACWFWSTNHVNKYCDKVDIVGMTKIINGGDNNLKDRQLRFEKALRIL